MVRASLGFGWSNSKSTQSVWHLYLYSPFFVSFEQGYYNPTEQKVYIIFLAILMTYGEDAMSILESFDNHKSIDLISSYI